MQQKNESHEEIVIVSIDRIVVNPLQPRKVFSEEDIRELAASIQEIGLIHPPVVRKIGDGCYEIIAGERRFRALKHLGRERISVLVRQSTDDESAKSALIENIQRVDLNPLEIAYAMQKIMQQFKFTQEALADRVGKKRSTVANYLRLIQLSSSIRQDILEGKLSMGHAKVILSVPIEKQDLLAKKIVYDGLNVRQSEQYANKMIKNPGLKKKIRQEMFTFEIKRQLEEHFGTNIAIQSEGPKGKVTFDYYSLDDLDRLLEKWGVCVH